MARPLKNGVDYFPFDTVLDTKFELIEAEFGLKGFAIVVKLLQKIYRENGYYCEWTKEVALLFSKNVNEGCSAVSEIVAASIKRGIFDKDLFDKYEILTSKGIQKRYFEAVSRRAQVNAIREYLLFPDTQIGENVNINSINVSNNLEIADDNTQTKQNKTKLNEIKENKTKREALPPAVVAIHNAYENHIGNMTPYIADSINGWLNKVDGSLILYAISEAVSHGNPFWSYCEGIIKNHYAAGRLTWDEAQKAQSPYAIEAERRAKEAEAKEENDNKYSELERRAIMKVVKYDYDEIRKRTFLNVTKPAGAEEQPDKHDYSEFEQKAIMKVVNGGSNDAK